MFLTKSKLTLAGLLIAAALTAGTAAVLGRQSDGPIPTRRLVVRMRKGRQGNPQAKVKRPTRPISFSSLAR